MYDYKVKVKNQTFNVNIIVGYLLFHDGAVRLVKWLHYLNMYMDYVNFMDYINPKHSKIFRHF